MVAQTLDFNFARGTILDDEYEDLGVSIAAYQRFSWWDWCRGINPWANRAMVFDTDNPTGGDFDLDYSGSGLGGALIISEDLDSSDPDDSARGGKVVFKFDEPVDLTSIVLLDAERGAKFKAYDADGNKIGVVRVGCGSDNDMRTIDLSSLEGVSKLKVIVKGSGALDNLVFDDGQPGGPGGDDTGPCAGADPSMSPITPGVSYNAPDDQPVTQGTDFADTIAGNGGDDTIYGNGGDDFLLGNTGDDLICGGEGNDTIHGSRDTDRIYGDAGDDFMAGNKGTDTISGGLGADTFNFKANTVEDGDLNTITDFSLAEGDTILLERFAEGSISTQVAGSDVEILADGDVFVLVQDTTLADVNAALVLA
ncbi:calcium-binding protein [Jannaschia aquimarina]|uniref:ApxIA_3 protein n=1 Tax=Jannaschia aquimarina TaxID=935700 RepID=A0A0D1ECH8_9RHOB|nr:calcium-binding protein [Jannaschia aquimarina]KIT14636.1 RTX-I toxin determinant A from serotypes 1/9 [Jannaschia aquimarina]SNT37502.1 Hemolysin-type calcium-binding repeat-containing protein [Jannaschia aquimarina]